MKKKLSMMLLAFVVAVTSFTAIDLVNNKAEAKDWVKKVKYGVLITIRAHLKTILTRQHFRFIIRDEELGPT